MTSTTSSNKQSQGFCGMLKWTLRSMTSLSVVYSVILLVVLPFMLAISLLGNGEGAQNLHNNEAIISMFKSNWRLASIIGEVQTWLCRCQLNAAPCFCRTSLQVCW